MAGAPADPRKKKQLHSQANKIRRGAQQHMKRQAEGQLVQATPTVQICNLPVAC